MSRKLLASVCTCLFIFCVFAVYASEFAGIDKNSDGKIVREEYIDGMKRTTFEKIDKNTDKVITWDEWSHFDKSPEARDHFNSMDKDNDSNITFGEFSDAMDNYSDCDDVFTSIDHDGNGAIGAGEYKGRPGVGLFKVKF